MLDKGFLAFFSALALVFGGCSRQSDGGAGATLGPGAIYRISEVTVAPESLDAYLAFAREVAVASVRNEPEVVSIFPMQDKADPTRIRIIEIYANESAYRAHIASAHFRRYKEGTLQMVRDLKLIDHRALVPALGLKVFRKAARHE